MIKNKTNYQEAQNDWILKLLYDNLCFKQLNCLFRIKNDYSDHSISIHIGRI
jgi:hypothetical protein